MAYKWYHYDKYLHWHSVKGEDEKKWGTKQLMQSNSFLSCGFCRLLLCCVCEHCPLGPAVKMNIVETYKSSPWSKPLRNLAESVWLHSSEDTISKHIYLSDRLSINGRISV